MAPAVSWDSWVRFSPVSPSKTCIFAGVDPQRGLLSRADVGCGVQAGVDLRALTVHVLAGVGGQVVEVARGRGRPADAEVGVDVGAHRLDQVDVHLERRAGLVADEGGVLEVLGADAHDHLAALAPLDRATDPVGHLQPAQAGGQRLALDGGGQEVHRRAADETGHEQVAGLLVELGGRAHLLHDPAAHHHDAVAERHRLGLVVGDVEGGGGQRLLDPRDLGAHLHAQLGVEVGQRLVHEERLGAAHDRPAHRDPLALPAGEVGRLAVEVLGQLQHGGGLVDLGLDGALVDPGEGQRERHVLAHRHVRVERVGLEHHRDVAVLGCLVVDHLAVDAQLALGDVLEPGDHVERRGLPAARGADQDDELAVGDGQVEVVDRQGPVGVALDDVVQDDFSHGLAPLLVVVGASP